MATLSDERASKPFGFTFFQQSGQGMHEDLAGQRIDPPRLMPIAAGAGGTGDVARERPHRGIRGVGSQEGDALSYERTGSRHQGKRASYTGAEHAASGTINIWLLNQPVVCRSDILD